MEWLVEWPGISQGLSWKEGREKSEEERERKKGEGERPGRGGAEGPLLFFLD